MAFVGDLKARLLLDDGSLQSSVDSALSQIGKLRDGLNGIENAARNVTLVDLENRFNQIGKAGIGAFSAIQKSGQEYESGLLRVNTLVNLSQEDLKALGEEIKTVSDRTGAAIEPTEALASEYEILSSGFTKTADASKVLEASLKLSSAGNAKAGDTTRVLTAILNAYGETAEDAAKRADQLFQTVNIGVTTVPELSASLGRVVSVASTAGVSFEELSAAIAVATQRGQTTSAAIDGLSGLLNSLIKPSKEAQKEMAALGIVIDEQSLKQDGLAGTLEKINKAANGNNASLGKIVGTHAAIATSTSLLRDGGIGLRDSIDQITNSAGANDKAIQILGAGSEEATKKMTVAFEQLKISASESLAPIQVDVVNTLTNLIKIADSAPGPIKLAALAFVGLGTGLSVAAGGFIAMRIALTAVKAELAVMGATIIPRLALAYTALNIPLGTAVGIFISKSLAMARASAEAVILAAKNAALFLSINGLKGSLTAAVAQFNLFGASMAGTVIGAAALAVGLYAVGKAYTDLEIEIQKANQALLESDDLQKKNRKTQGNVSFSTSEILGTDVRKLARKGLTKDTVTQRILDEQRGTTQLRNEGATEQQIQASIDRAKKLKQIRIDLEKELQNIKDEDAKVNKSDPKIIKTKEQLREEKKAEKQKQKDQKESLSGALRDIDQTIDATKTANDEQYKAEQKLAKDKEKLRKEEERKNAKAEKQRIRDKKESDKAILAAEKQRIRDSKNALKGGSFFDSDFSDNAKKKAADKAGVTTSGTEKKKSAFDFTTGSRTLSGSEFGGQVLTMDQFIAQQAADFGNNPFQNRLGGGAVKKATEAKIDQTAITKEDNVARTMQSVIDAISKQQVTVPVTVNVDGKKAASGTVGNSSSNAKNLAQSAFNAAFVLGEA